MPNDQDYSEPSTFYGTLLEAGRRWGVIAVIALAACFGCGWFLWKQTEFIQTQLVDALKEQAAGQSKLINELDESASLRRDVRAVIEQNSRSIDKNSATLEKTQQVLIETQHVLKERM